MSNDMTQKLEHKILEPTADIEFGRPYQVIQALTFVQEWKEFSAQYPFRSLLIRVVLFILFIRVLLDIILEVHMINDAFTSPKSKIILTTR